MTDTRTTDFGLASDLAIIDKVLNLESMFLVDAGCGNMHLSRELAKRGASVLAIDPDPIQAAKNKKADITANVGFAEAGADAIPVESSSIDGILFPYSLHHIPKEKFGIVFDEVCRILKPEGFAYVMEPVAAGELNEIMVLFHDERMVRENAQVALDKLAIPRFAEASVYTYSNNVSFKSWDHFANAYAGKSYNTSYREEDVRNEAVRETFEKYGKPLDYSFLSPMRITHLQRPLNVTA